MSKNLIYLIISGQSLLALSILRSEKVFDFVEIFVKRRDFFLRLQAVIKLITINRKNTSNVRLASLLILLMVIVKRSANNATRLVGQ